MTYENNWGGMDGATAWHLIDRHADDWHEVGELMNAWLRANSQRSPANALEAALETALATLEQIATTPRNRGARRNASATLSFLQTQLDTRHDYD